MSLTTATAALVNAATNAACLTLLRAHRSDGVNLKASWIFTTNDMYANAGIAISGIAAMWINTRLPDLIIGLIVVVIAFAGGREILKQAGATGQKKQSNEASERIKP